MAEVVVAGIDWASELHVACVLDGDGAVAGRFSFTHDGAAIGAMVRRLRSAGVARVAIERGDGPVVEELLAAGLGVFVVPSRQIKGLRTRYGSAGNKDDRFDAYVLADTLRTDGHRWKPLRPDTEATRAPRALCHAGIAAAPLLPPVPGEAPSSSARPAPPGGRSRTCFWPRPAYASPRLVTR